MLSRTSNLKGFAIEALDGELGTVDDLYFDDESWGIRYLTVDTGTWLNGRSVLISPLSVVRTNLPGRRLEVSLTKKQVENSPDIDTHKPVSRQQEATYRGYYGYGIYWREGPDPIVAVAEVAISTEGPDSHLRSTKVVTGYHIEASDGMIGHVDGFLVDDDGWAIRYLEVATTNWWPGKKVLISPGWVDRVSWADSKVFVGVSREAIQTGPEYYEWMVIGREYESKLHAHYGRPPYWKQEVQHEVPAAMRS